MLSFLFRYSSGELHLVLPYPTFKPFQLRLVASGNYVLTANAVLVGYVYCSWCPVTCDGREHGSEE